MVCGYRPTPAGGGIEKHVYELTRGLIKRGIHVEIICEDAPFLPDFANPLAARIVGIPPKPLRRGASVEHFMERSKQLAEAIDPNRYDIVHCHGQYGYHIALQWTELARRPLLISAFHLTALGPIERYRKLGLHEPLEAADDRAVAVMEETIGSLSDHCIAVSRGVEKEMIDFYGVPHDRVQVIANWCDPRVFRPFDHWLARRSLNLPDERSFLLYVGHFNMSRGKIMAEALRRLPESVALLVVHHEADEAISAEFGDRIRFIGHLTPQRLALYYSAADLLCFPALYGGFGLVLLEAMACGCPPVVFNYAAMNELVTTESGYLVGTPTPQAYAATVQRALSDNRRKASAARRRAQAFDMESQIGAVLRLYRRLLWETAASSKSAS